MKYPLPKEDFTPVHGLVVRGITAQVVLETVKFKLYDALELKPAPVKELAAYFGFEEIKLGAVVDLLETYGLVRNDDGVVSNTALASEYLVSSSPLYQGKAMALTMDFCDGVSRNFEGLLKGSNKERDDTDNSWSTTDTMEGTAQEALSGGLQNAVEAVCRLDGFSNFRLMGDLGGNHGNYTMSILDRNPGMDGVILDLPHVAPHSEERCARMGYSGRIKAVGLDMRKDALPRMDFDLIFASHVLYGCNGNFSPLLTGIAEALRPGGWFAAHHYAKTGSAMSPQTIASLEIVTKFAGYFSHFVEPDNLESELSACGFGNFQRTCTDSCKGIMLISAQKIG